MDGFSDQLKTVLNDPESMAKIAELAKKFAARNEAPTPPTGEAPPLPLPAGEESASMPFGNVLEGLRSPAIAEALRLLSNGSRERVALLQAMRPFVREEKKEKLDKIIQTMKTLDLITSAQKLI